MKNIGIGLCLFFPVLAAAQNVGIGTTAPVTKLNIIANANTPAVPGTASAGIFRIGVSANEGIDFGKMGSSPFSGWVQAGFDGTTPDPLSLQPVGGNVGIGTLLPAAKLQINHNSLFAPGIRLVDSGFTNSGVIQFRHATLSGGMTMTATATSNFSLHKSLRIASDSMTVLTIGGQGYVGIRDISPDYPLDVTGDINTTGRILINDNPGTSRQVLTSNGAADPTWEDAAYSNNVRFAFGISTNAAAPTGNARFSSTHYNLSPSEVTVATDEITISRAGLYHLDFFLSGETTFASAPASPPRLYFSFQCGFTPMLLVNSKVLDAASTTYFKMVESYSMNVYLPAGTVLRLFHSFSSSGTSYFVNGHLLGHLISE